MGRSIASHSFYGIGIQPVDSLACYGALPNAYELPERGCGRHRVGAVERLERLGLRTAGSHARYWPPPRRWLQLVLRAELLRAGLRAGLLRAGLRAELLRSVQRLLRSVLPSPLRLPPLRPLQGLLRTLPRRLLRAELLRSLLRGALVLHPRAFVLQLAPRPKTNHPSATGVREQHTRGCPYVFKAGSSFIPRGRA